MNDRTAKSSLLDCLSCLIDLTNSACNNARNAKLLLPRSLGDVNYPLSIVFFPIIHQSPLPHTPDPLNTACKQHPFAMKVHRCSIKTTSSATFPNTLQNHRSCTKRTVNTLKVTTLNSKPNKTHHLTSQHQSAAAQEVAAEAAWDSPAPRLGSAHLHHHSASLRPGRRWSFPDAAWVAAGGSGCDSAVLLDLGPGLVGPCAWRGLHSRWPCEGLRRSCAGWLGRREDCLRC